VAFECQQGDTMTDPERNTCGSDRPKYPPPPGLGTHLPRPCSLPDRVVRFSATNPPAFYAIAWLFALQFALLFNDVRAFFLDAASLARVFLF
jgi:hypothetical protein